MEQLEIKNAKKQLNVTESVIDGSKFTKGSLQHLYFEDINMSGTKIINANLSDLEIEGAQLGGAYIHNIGMPPEGHFMYDANAKQRSLRFEDCDLNNSSITNCNLNGVTISDCNLEGMKINGILVEELLKAAGK
ncbi:MAG: pentapeptide repeat-containing protein [Bacteroidota bacterium]